MDRLQFSQQQERESAMNILGSQLSPDILNTFTIKGSKDYYDPMYGMITFENRVFDFIDTEEF